MAPVYDQNTADFMAERGPEKLVVWLRQDGATFGIIAGNGATNFLNDRHANAVQFVNNAMAQGFVPQRFTDRWNNLSNARTPSGTRRRVPMVTFAEGNGPAATAHTVSIYEQNGQFMLTEIESGEPTWTTGTFHEVVAEMFKLISAGWQVARVSPEFITRVEMGLGDVTPEAPAEEAAA
jgi:hypothetical protein